MALGWRPGHGPQLLLPCSSCADLAPMPGLQASIHAGSSTCCQSGARQVAQACPHQQGEELREHPSDSACWAARADHKGHARAVPDSLLMQQCFSQYGWKHAKALQDQCPGLGKRMLDRSNACCLATDGRRIFLGSFLAPWAHPPRALASPWSNPPQHHRAAPGHDAIPIAITALLAFLLRHSSWAGAGVSAACGSRRHRQSHEARVSEAGGK